MSGRKAIAITVVDPNPSTRYAVLRRTDDGHIWIGRVGRYFEAFSEDAWIDGAHPFTESLGGGLHQLQVRGTLPEGSYLLTHHRRAGDEPLPSDPTCGTNSIEWTGTTLRSLSPFEASQLSQAVQLAQGASNG